MTTKMNAQGNVLPRSIVFDMDGVLIDSERLIRESWIAVGRLLHLDGIGDLFGQCLGVSYEGSRIIFTERFGTRVSYDGFRKLARDHYLGLVREDIPVKPGVRGILGWLRSEGWKIGLASSTRQESVLESLSRTGLIGYFGVIICGDMVRASKPEPDIYLAACSALQEVPSLCYAVEDSRNGLISAHAAGMRTVLIPDLIAPDEEMRRLASAVFPSMTAFHQWLLQEGPAPR
jgi:HAD superfamily hydrolase (TIGR01509 family)